MPKIAPKIARAMAHPILGTIDDRIAELEREIARLTIARSVFVDLNPPPKLVWKDISGGDVTEKQLNRIALKQAKIRTPGMKAEYKGYVADQILYAMDRLKGGPADSHTIWTEVITEAKDMPIKRVWNTLYVLVKQGKVTKLGNQYALPATETPIGLQT